MVFTVTAIEEALVCFFEQVAQQDSARLEKIQQEQCFSVAQGRWCFTLPDLYLFLQHQDPAFTRIDYKIFRQSVFNSPINDRVKSLGAEIVIADNHASVDRSTYALVWLTT